MDEINRLIDDSPFRMAPSSVRRPLTPAVQAAGTGA